MTQAMMTQNDIMRIVHNALHPGWVSELEMKRAELAQGWWWHWAFPHHRAALVRRIRQLEAKVRG